MLAAPKTQALLDRLENRPAPGEKNAKPEIPLKLTLSNQNRPIPWKSAAVIAKADATAALAALAALAARQATVRAIAREIIAFAKEQKEQQKSGTQMDAAAKKRAMAVFEKLIDLKEADFAILLDEVRSDPSLPAQAKGELIGMSVMMLAQQNPRSALQLVLDSKDLLKDNPGMSFMAGMAIGRLAETDPAAAFA